MDNRRITIREVADDVGISCSSCQAILTNVLDMKRASAKIFSKLLHVVQKHKSSCHSLVGNVLAY